jgi:hypothetical protein
VCDDASCWYRECIKREKESMTKETGWCVMVNVHGMLEVPFYRSMIINAAMKRRNNRVTTGIALAFGSEGEFESEAYF